MKYTIEWNIYLTTSMACFTNPKCIQVDHTYYVTLPYLDIVITHKGLHLLIMGTFNRFLLLNQFCMDKIKYCWNILSRSNKSMVVISTTNFLTIIKAFV